ncbi:MAG TPA: cupin domain-containing protein [Stellaceae bacterium]|nr:cupin domain-containing protein [Stellaceae bacterium]
MQMPKDHAIADLQSQMRSFIGRHADKRFDWDAFPANRGFPELERAQMRYIGAGGSPKVDDRTTLKAEHFTLSLIHQPVGKYAAAHAHEVKESFLVLQGILTVGWAWDEEVIETHLGPKDLCLNASGRPHGFRNEGIEPVLCSITVGSGRPLAPIYACHPRDHDPAIAAAFGAKPGTVHALAPDSADPRHAEFARHIVRYRQQPAQFHPADFGRKVYIGEGGAPASSYRMDLIDLPRSRGVGLYEREVEDVYLVLEGVLTVGWAEGGRVFEERLGAKDAVFNPAGRPHYFRNDGFEDAQFMMLVGTPKPEDVVFRAAA